MTRQRFFKWTQPAKSRLRPRLAAPQNQGPTGQSRKLSDIEALACVNLLTLQLQQGLLQRFHEEILAPHYRLVDAQFFVQMVDAAF